MATTDLVDRNTELKPFLGISIDDTRKDGLLNILNDQARALVESYLDRHLVTRGAITEFHSPRRAETAIYMTQWPIISVTSVHEDSGRTYDATSLLTVTTDYIVSKQAGKLIRVSSDIETTWLTGFRPIQVIYTAGYASTAVIPREIKYETLRIIGAMWSETTLKQWNMSSVADDVGNISRFVPAGINADARRVLAAYKRLEHVPTGEVDA